MEKGVKDGCAQWSTVRHEVDILCASVERTGGECLFIAVSHDQANHLQVGSAAGKLFLSSNSELLQKFQLFCDSYWSTATQLSLVPPPRYHGNLSAESGLDTASSLSSNVTESQSLQLNTASSTEDKHDKKEEKEDNDDDNNDKNDDDERTFPHIDFEGAEGVKKCRSETTQRKKGDNSSERLAGQDDIKSSHTGRQRTTRTRQKSLNNSEKSTVKPTTRGGNKHITNKTHTGPEAKSDLCVCDVCGQNFETNLEVMKHTKLEHINKKDFRCQLCSKVFNTKYGWTLHQFRTHGHQIKGKVTYECKDCGQSFISKSRYLRHIPVHKKQTKSTDQANSNSVPEPKSLTCRFCSKKFRLLSTHKKHEDLHQMTNGGQNFQCPVCLRLCKTEETYKYHMRLHLPDNEKPYQCEICNKGFPSKRGLDVHKIRHSKVKNFVCELCGSAFKEKRFLSVHLRIHTGEKPYKCETCGKSFRSNSSLRQHRSVHNQSVQICDHCGQMFNSRRRLNAHLKRLEGQTVKCDICNKVFKSLDGYKGHYVVTHLKESGISSFPNKVYQCSHCGKLLHSNEAYTRHIRVHTGDRPFECKQCGKSFAEKGNLNAHLKIHRDDKRFKCTKCDKRFIHNRTLKKHMSTHTSKSNHGNTNKGNHGDKSAEHTNLTSDTAELMVTEQAELLNFVRDGVSVDNNIVQIDSIDQSVHIDNTENQNVQFNNIGTSVQISNLGNTVQISNLGNNVQISDIGTPVQISDIGNTIQITDLGSNVQISNIDNTVIGSVTNSQYVGPRVTDVTIPSEGFECVEVSYSQCDGHISQLYQ